MIVSDTGAKFTFPHLVHNEAVTVEENTPLKLEFNISSCCKSTQSLLTTITIQRPTKDRDGYGTKQRFCQYVHVNGSCVGGTSECLCPANSTELYTLVKTVDRSYNGTWTWSADVPSVQQTGLDVFIKCKYFTPSLGVSFCVCVYAKKNTKKRLFFHPSLNVDVVIFSPPRLTQK